jgi:predicted nucleotidyltransferase
MQVFTSQQISQLEGILWVKKTPGTQEQILWEKVAKYTPLFAKIPGVLCICVGNSLAMNATHQDSDIDLFIITKQKRLWMVRILFTLLLTFLWERKTAHQHSGKFCLSFFITENALDLSTIAIKNDIYLSYWIHTLKPILNRRHNFEKFREANTQASASDLHQKKTYSSYEKLEELLPPKKLLIFMGDTLEATFKFFFLPKTKKSFQKLWKPFGVIISDDMLKFHDQDRRKELRDTIFS